MIPSAERIAAVTPAFLRFEGVLKEYSLTKHQLRPLLQSGEVYGKKVGRIWLVSRESLEDYLYADQRKVRLALRGILG